MTQYNLMRTEDRFPDVLSVESAVKGIHYLIDNESRYIAIAPSGWTLAETREGPLLRITREQARTLCEELAGILEVYGG